MKQVIRRHVAVLLVIFLVSTVWAQQAKYVFYFIGDGMGVNQVNGTEMYLAEQEGRIGVKPLLFTAFPAGTMATTFSATNSVTDSSAAGTALATGEKTYNGAVSMDDDKNVLSTVAERAKKAGRKVGIATSVSVDHATPAAFYAHQPNRSRYYEIALDLPKAGFDFYAGSGFLKPTTTADKKEAPNVFPIIEEAGYTIARGLDEYKEKAADAKKMILIQKEGAEPSCLPYAIDHEEGDLTLPEITESAVTFLSKGNKKGFFLMVEGGKIDWACHSNDPVTVFEEVIDLDNAVRVAYEFYKKHPKETLIVVTADHETGGMGLGIGKYELHLKSLLNQKQSQDLLSKAITDLRKDKAGKASWNEIKDLLTEKMGFWKELPLTWEQEKMLRDEYEQSFVKNKVVFEESLYARTEPLAAAARKVMSQIAMVGWTSSSHTAGYVPVFAIGAGADLFTGKMDNTEIPKRIAKAAGYK
ncbi:alkaline phosphatase [Bacteroides eggerthii]|jgi:alkaline phosphatase|uniref:alkaline phosphatase n=1 Tax=Bacteroides eggerthii TaxID=28111 RepID=UPI001E2A1C5A|nr:alkaline phosphatase [Bacteroides eggerthii]